MAVAQKKSGLSPRRRQVSTMICLFFKILINAQYAHIIAFVRKVSALCVSHIPRVCMQKEQISLPLYMQMHHVCTYQSVLQKLSKYLQNCLVHCKVCK